MSSYDKKMKYYAGIVEELDELILNANRELEDCSKDSRIRFLNNKISDYEARKSQILEEQRTYKKEKNSRVIFIADYPLDVLEDILEECNAANYEYLLNKSQYISSLIESAKIQYDNLGKREYFTELSESDLRKVSIIKNLKSHYQDAIKELSKTMTSLEKDGKEYLKIKADIEVLKLVVNTMSSHLSQVSKIIKKNEREKHRKDTVLKEEVLTRIEKKKKNAILRGEKVRFNNMSSLLKITRNIVSKEDDLEQTEKYISCIDLSLLTTEERDCYYKSVINTIKNKYQLKGRNHPVLKSLSKMISNYKEYIEEDRTNDNVFAILQYLFRDEANEAYLRRIFMRSPRLANIKNSLDTSVLSYIANLFITNSKIELINQSRDYVPCSFYARIYNYLVTNPLFEIEEEDKQYASMLLENYKQELIKSNYKTERKHPIIQMLEEINTKKEEIHHASIMCDHALLYSAMKMSLRDQKRKDYNLLHTIAIKNKDYSNYAYSVEFNPYDNGKIDLYVHVSDVSFYLENDFLNEKELKEKLFSDDDGELFDKYTREELLSLKVGEERPAITYHFVVNKSGRAESYEVCKSIVKVDEECSKEQLEDRDFRLNERMMPYWILNSYLDKDNLNDRTTIDQNFSRLVNNVVGDYHNSNKKPFIYKVCHESDATSMASIVGDLNYIFSKLSNDEFKAIFTSICEEKKKAHYSTRNFGHFGLDTKYHTDILCPCDSYIGILLQGISKYSIQNKEYTSDSILEQIVEDANRLLYRN